MSQAKKEVKKQKAKKKLLGKNLPLRNMLGIPTFYIFLPTVLVKGEEQTKRGWNRTPGDSQDEDSIDKECV